MNTQRPKVEIEPHYVEYLIREVERNQSELQILRAEAKITHGFLGLAERLTAERTGHVMSADSPLDQAKKAFEASVFEMQNKAVSQS